MLLWSVLIVLRLREGTVTQVKMPETMKFISLEESEKNPVPPR